MVTYFKFLHNSPVKGRKRKDMDIRYVLRRA